ncbi:3-oxoacyl-ACP reductase [Halogeometricum pallidum JCM 14848]|uniref:3-oxoacyl-ACP reductase n=1 Tax=Halogeometricum pallidum JCM 14848 TaxID=1227487 RepID=M0D1E5_HALPD|nr:SDR family NAD(P)-dependent oxidoreductase [Halogeometricum pallidum]ELZ27969.1 3-oxoacyl-ACP reductase [Halogeometricum pallidum JCM 14848]
MEFDLAERVALVTGAGRGNGREIALTLAEQGASVVVNDVDEEAADETAREIEAGGGEAVAVAADVSDPDEVAAMVEVGTETVGTVDILVNNAGIGGSGPFLDPEYRNAFRDQLDVHLHGSLNCIREVVDGMAERGYGKITNVTSIHTKNGVGMAAQYDVAKFGLLGLTKSLALELGREGVRVNAVAPGWVNTRMTADFDPAVREKILDNNPLGSFAESEDIASAVAFLSSPASDYVNGHELRVDGGQVPVNDLRNGA